jgi:carbonic anhydrase
VKLHGIRNIVVVDHLGCGMYEKIYNNGDKMTIEQEENFHRKNQAEFVATLNKKYPNLVVKTYLLR